MTRLDQRKTRARYETGAVIFDRRTRPVLVELHIDYLELRLKGCRQRYAVPYSKIYDRAMKDAALAETVARRIAKKKGKI